MRDLDDRQDPRERWASLGGLERDAAYDNNAAVRDSAVLIAQRNAASAQFRRAHAACVDIPYGPLPRNRFDLFPGGDAKAPCLVFIHGGYWQRNSREDFAIIAAGLRPHGWSVALPGYTLGPQATVTQINAEIFAALDWLQRDGALYGVAGDIVVSGWSAGAQLAALALAHHRVMAGLAISGVFDLRPLRDTALDQNLHLTDEEIEQLSPLRRPAIMKPLAIAYGTAELPTLVGDARQFHAARAAANAPGPLLAVNGADHFRILDELSRPQGVLTKTVLDLVKP
jgi:arylformamidase